MITSRAIAASDQVVFWLIGSQVYRAASGSAMDSWGLPMSRRWECSLDHWKRFRAIYEWAKDL